MHKKMVKAITGSLMAATMAATTAAAFVAPMSASAGNCLGQNDFDDGVGLPWHTCVTQPAKQTFEIADGVYRTTIDNVGGVANGAESRWDVQFRHRSLHIHSGHTYKISFDINSTADGELATHLADLAGENPQWLSNHGGTQAWNYTNTSCGSCPNGHGQSSGNIKIKKGDNHFESEFTATGTIEVAEWAFHYGGAGEFQDKDCFPVGTTLEFDNMKLECVSCGDTFKSKEETPCLWDTSNELGVVTARNDVRINQQGYFTNLSKKATYATDEAISSPVSYVIKNSSGTVVYEGTAESGSVKDTDSGEYVQILDFTDADIPEGDGYYIEVDDAHTWTNEKTGETFDMHISHPFAINNNIYDGMLKNALNYYYQNRSGIDIEEKYITSGDTKTLAHEGGHAPSDMAYVQSEWKKSYAGVFDGDKTYQIDCYGGWYDAGDHGKYVVNGGISVWTLQNIYEWSKAQGTDSKFADGKTMAIPEQTNGKPDILDEARVELEWMIDSMVVKSADPYYGKYAGMVYHKMHDHKWTGLATKPYDYQDEWGTTRIVKPPSYAASLNLAAAAAQAARLWKGIDDTFAAKCLTAAENAYKAVKDNYAAYDEAKDKDNPNSLYAPLDQAIGGGAYGDNYVDDDMYWAACELYATTGDASYYNDLKGYNNPNNDLGTDKAFSLTTSLGGGENSGSFSSFNWGCTAGLGTLTLYLNKDNSALTSLTAENVATIESSIVAAAQAYVDKENEQGMGIPYQSTTFQDAINIGEGIDVYGYEWGSNSFVVNNAIVMAYAYDIKGTNEFISGVSTAMDYILGRNANGISYVTGYGEYAYSRPHHRYWSYELDNTFPMAPAGVMSGGPGQGLQDPYVAGLGYDRDTAAPQTCYVDSIEAWSVNEVTINWNAPFAWVVSFLEDEAADAPEPGQDPTDDPGTSDSDLEVTLWGDADCNGVVNINDAAVIMSYVSNREASPITAQGLVNADVYQNGDGLSNMDALSVQKKLAQLIAELPES